MATTLKLVENIVHSQLNLGEGSKVLAEYIINLYENDRGSFKTELAQFSDSFVSDVEHIIVESKLNENQIYRAQCKSVDSEGSKIELLDLGIGGIVPDQIYKAGQEVEVKFTKFEHDLPVFVSLESLEVSISREAPSFLSSETIDLGNRGPNVDEQDKQSTLMKTAIATASKMNENQKQAENRSYNKPMARPARPEIESQSSKQLPIESLKQEVISLVSDNSICIVVGNTGSGKTTQITKFLLEAGFDNNNKVIACTQPRRIAAISVAKRVSQDLGSKVGKLVGYSVRFDDCYSHETAIKYMTDGLLLRELLTDPDLTKYSVVMLDEAHERTVSTDILFSLLKMATKRRPELRIIVTSATLDAQKFSTYFDNAPILQIPGRTYPVDINYLVEPTMDYMESMFNMVKQIHETQESGDILVFLTGQAEIDFAVSKISNFYPNLLPLPVYSALSNEMQQVIFNPADEGVRKVILATNIAETSLTIDGIKFVVDSGFSKLQVWDSKVGMSVLKVHPISQAQANQRAGRAGRTAPGRCYRLYTKESFDNEMEKSIAPELLRQNLDNTVLILKAMGIPNVAEFDFMDKPDRAEVLRSMYNLYLLGGLDEQGGITQIGMEMSHLPLDPALAAVLLQSITVGNDCFNSVATIISMLNVPTIYLNPQTPAWKRREAEKMHQRLVDPTGDHLTLHNIYTQWEKHGFSKKWCESNYIQHKSMIKVRDVRKQLLDMMATKAKKLKPESLPRAMSGIKSNSESWKNDVLKSLCVGFFSNIAKSVNNEYFTLNGDMKVAIHPSSVLFQKKPTYVLYNSLILTSREYMHVVSQIKPGWLVEMVPHFFKNNASEKGSKKRKINSEAIKERKKLPGSIVTKNFN